MGTFLCPGKDYHYWNLVNTRYGKNVFTTDKSLIPYVSKGVLDYVDLYPELYNPSGFNVLTVYINGQKVGQAWISSPSGLFYLPIRPPRKKFILTVVNAQAQILKREYYNAKREAWGIAVQAQSYNFRDIQLQYVARNQVLATLADGEIYPQFGVFFGFPPPPGWPIAMYRNAVLGDGGAHPGFINSFLKGGSAKGFCDTISSITGQPVTLGPVLGGKRWQIFDPAHAPNPATPGPNSWYLCNSPSQVPVGGNQIQLLSPPFVRRSIQATIPGSYRTISNENVLKTSDSFIQGANQETFPALPGTSLSFSINGINYSTIFGASTTTAAQAAADIRAQNPSLTAAVYAVGGNLRIGTAPISGEEIPIVINAGSSLPILGFVAGQLAEVSADQIANPNQVGGVNVTWNAITYTQNSDYSVDLVNGRIVWSPSTAVNNLPPMGSTYQISYTYIMAREILFVANQVKDPSINVVFNFQP